MTLLSTLARYKERFDQQLQEELEQLAPPSLLRDSCAYALTNGGKRIRPAVVLAVSDALGYGLSALPAALCVEFHHTASLIADDLPCMDDDDERRGKPSCHKVFGEATALLASFGLIAAGYEQLSKNGKLLATAPPPFCLYADEACRLAVENVSQTTGLQGIIGGQFSDLYPPSLTREVLHETLARKTAALFESSCLLGWLFGGGSLEEELLKKVRQMGIHLGMIFQIVDDLLDAEKDRAAERAINAALLLGQEGAIEWLKKEKSSFDQLQQELKLESKELSSIAVGLLEMGSSCLS